MTGELGEFPVDLPKFVYYDEMAAIDKTNSIMNCSEPDLRTRFQKLRDRLFPARHCFAPDAPSEFKDCIHGHAVTMLSWADRFRVLLTGVVVTSWRTVTENEVGRTVNAATCHIGTTKDLRRLK